jgi:hypothetical protein
VWPASPGAVVTGIATGPWAPGLAAGPPSDSLPWVWAGPEGELRGLAVEPLYKSMPAAARRDPRLHALLALVDGIRAGDDELRAVAVRELRARLGTGRPAASRRAATLSMRGQDGKKGQRVHG